MVMDDSVGRRKALRSEMNAAALLKFAEGHIDEAEGNCKNVLWTGESETELFGLNEKHLLGWSIGRRMCSCPTKFSVVRQLLVLLS